MPELEAGHWISIYAMMVSLMAMVIQLIFGVLAQRRAKAETDRQIAETRKQEKLHALEMDENYKCDVREWGRNVVGTMALAQQLCVIDPENLTPDYEILRAQTVGVLRGQLDKAKWLFPNLAVATREDDDWWAEPGRKISALETILYAYHALDSIKPNEQESRADAVIQIRKMRKTFVKEIRKAVDPRVQGADIERIIAEISMPEIPEPETDAAREAIITAAQGAGMRK